MMFTSRRGPGSPMVLYHAVSSYQLLEVMLHRMIFHPGERAVLVLPDFIVNKYPQYRRLVKGRFFEEVYLFPYLRIPHRQEERILEDVSRSYRQVIAYTPSDFSQIYVAGAHFYFSLYLIQNQTPFVFLEDAAGMLSRPQVLDQALSVNFPIHASIARKYGLFDGSNPWISQVICLKEAQIRDVSGKRYQNFSVEDALETLSPQKRKRLIHFFLQRRIRTLADAVLLTQHFANLGMMSYEEQERLYRAMRERIPRDTRLLIKKHPDDTLDYKGIFPEAHTIRTVFPAELLPYAFVRKPEILYTFDSTGCENLKKHFIIRKIEREPYAK